MGYVHVLVKERDCTGLGQSRATHATQSNIIMLNVVQMAKVYSVPTDQSVL